MHLAPAMLLAVMLAAAVYLLATGLRRRYPHADPTHPLCRRCGHDLFGAPRPVTTCAECGADLTRKRAVAKATARRPLFLAMGLVLMPPLASPWMLDVYLDAARWKPTWWLRQDAWLLAWHAASCERAIVALDDRLMLGRLPDSQRDAIERDLYAAQRGTYGWHDAWGDVFATLFVQGALSRDEIADYMRRGTEVRLWATPEVRMGDAFDVELYDSRRRRGRNMSLTVEMSGNRLELAGRPVRPLRGEGRLTTAKNLQLDTGSYAFVLAGSGDHHLSSAVDARVDDPYSPRGEPLVKWSANASRMIRVLPSGVPTPEKVRDEELARLVRDRTRIVELGTERDGRLFVITVAHEALPVGLAHCVFIADQAGVEWEVGRIDSPGRPSRAIRLEVPLAMPMSSKVRRLNVILRPAIAGLPSTRGIERALDHELVFEDVVVRRE